jgi:hypothetical protein
VNHHHILTLHEPSGSDRANEFIEIGIPLPEGEVFDAREVQLVTENDQHIDCSARSTAFWPDNSIKWCLLKFQVSLQSDQRMDIFLNQASPESQGNGDTPVKEQSGTIEINTGDYLFSMVREPFHLINQIHNKDRTLVANGKLKLNINDDIDLTGRVTSIRHEQIGGNQESLGIETTINGRFVANKESPRLKFSARLLFLTRNNQIHCSFTLHNPERAIHPGNIWDLGDENSLYINDFSLEFDLQGDPRVSWKIDPTAEWNPLDNKRLSIYQESSGGENWNSPNHKNRHETVPMSLRGYRCESDGDTREGERASPLIKIDGDGYDMAIAVKDFWQNFPKAISIDGKKLALNLFPSQFPDSIELQPGEKKTHSFYLSFSGEGEDLRFATAPIDKTYNTAWLDQCGVFKFSLVDSPDDPVENIIKEGLTRDKYNFFAKRETVDEYGWRNFGDLYADHETSQHKGNDIFVSHYNNQYDPIYGFLYQYLLTGNSKWFELADDLARHVTDIDIYHTDRDKDEYNHGLFWHTDHYLNAETSSHRSFSRRHNYVYEGHAGGGGPGGQHCYSTGLLFHYLLTGFEPSRQAVLGMSDWIQQVYEGSGTLLSFLLAIKRSRQIDAKNILTGHYPLDRGTGYYINTLMDRFVLTREKEVLEKVEYVIQHTVHPKDDIDARDLADVERRWYYTVFLQYLCRYLSIKAEIGQLDDDFYYARDTLLHYADWMAEHEYPYLEKPEILEFPNHTWTAQDMRKVTLLSQAAYYAPDEQQKYLDKAQQIYRYIVANLSQETTRTYTRILAILMQNPMPQRLLNNPEFKDRFGSRKNYSPPLEPSRSRSIASLLTELKKIKPDFSISNEVSWLKKRSAKFRQYFGDIS